MAPRATGDDEFSVAVRSMIVTVRDRLERGLQCDLEAVIARQATAFVDLALENEKNSEEAAKEALKASEKAKIAKKNAKACFEMLCGLLNDDEASVEPLAIQEGSHKEEEMAHGASTAGEEA